MSVSGKLALNAKLAERDNRVRQVVVIADDCAKFSIEGPSVLDAHGSDVSQRSWTDNDQITLKSHGRNAASKKQISERGHSNPPPSLFGNNITRTAGVSLIFINANCVIGEGLFA